MKKPLLVIFVTFIIHTSFSLNVDYGASIDSYVGFNLGKEFDIFGFEKVSIYSSLEFTEDISLALDGFYNLNYTKSSGVSESFPLDFETVLLTLPIAGMDFAIGRQALSDYGSMVLSHKLDGVVFDIPLGPANLEVKAGVTTLVQNISLATTDKDGETITRLVDGADLVRDFDSFTLWASVYSSQDFLAITKNLPIYIGGGVSGSITTDIFYTVKGNFLTGTFYSLNDNSDSVGTPTIAGMGTVNLTWFVNMENELIKMISPYVTLDFGISSGDKDMDKTTSIGTQQATGSIVTAYRPLTPQGPGSIYSVSNENLTYFKLNASASPIDKLQTQLGSTLFIRTVEGAFPGIESDVTSNSGKYLGTEVSLTGNYRPFSDLGVSLTGGMFFPNSTLITSGVYGLVTAYVSLSI